MKLIDLTGERFGKLVVVQRDTSITKRGTYWICKCDCGNIISTRTDQLKRGKTSCGCDTFEKLSKIRTKEEIGNRYGYLTVLSRVPSITNAVRWHCICDCGKECDVDGVNLRNGNVQSCGCKRYESHNMINETGNRYGKLVVLSRSNKTDGCHVFWNCKCDCGNTCEVNGTHLRLGNTLSCGCLKSKGEQAISELLVENHILFKKEYYFDDLIGTGGRPLKFDFAIFHNNGELSHLIEYDGEQHFRPIEQFGGENEFETRKKHDSMKDDYCRSKRIKLIRIKYYDIITLEKIIGE